MMLSKDLRNCWLFDSVPSGNMMSCRRDLVGMRERGGINGWVWYEWRRFVYFVCVVGLRSVAGFALIESLTSVMVCISYSIIIFYM
jgi:hypothetical protein